jgi:hypothetical protein
MLESSTFEFTGLRGFLRWSGGPPGWASGSLLSKPALLLLFDNVRVKRRVYLPRVLLKIVELGHIPMPLS